VLVQSGKESIIARLFEVVASRYQGTSSMHVVLWVSLWFSLYDLPNPLSCGVI
jgi:hypothetical protein